MRNELKNFNWHIYGLGERDIDFAYDLVKDIINDRNKILGDYSERIKKEYPESFTDIMDDIGYYHGLENLIFWQFALWRLQGIFEGMIILNYLKDPSLIKKLIGLKAKLNKIKDSGFPISQNDYESLIDWGELRNALSHCPPEKYGDVDLKEEDIKEFIALIKRVMSVWDKKIV
ncbi:MAG: hypothetical protein WCB96_11930 [Candidatus Aminicenantales bacterium]